MRWRAILAWVKDVAKFVQILVGLVLKLVEQLAMCRNRNVCKGSTLRYFS